METRNTTAWPTALGVVIALAIGSVSAGAVAQDRRNDNPGGPPHAQQGGPGAPGSQGRGDDRGGRPDDRNDGRGNNGPGNDGRGDDNRGNDNRGASNPGRDAPRAQYQFRDQDRDALRAHYSRNLKSVRADRRPQFQRGAPIPPNYRGYITPLPASVRSRIAPPPRGYAVGYYQGYSVVYDPATYVVLSVLDLLTR